MTFSEMISFAKLFSIALGGQPMTLAQAEMESACETLKILAEERADWNPAQREMYKALVDFTKAQIEGHTNG